MRIIADNDDYVAIVLLAGVEHVAVEFMPSNYASIDADGRIVGLDLMDTQPVGEPFDEAAAGRALEVAEQALSGTPDAAS
jgi:predicted HAD superfamily phosphohydrolase